MDKDQEQRNEPGQDYRQGSIPNMLKLGNEPDTEADANADNHSSGKSKRGWRQVKEFVHAKQLDGGGKQKQHEEVKIDHQQNREEGQYGHDQPLHARPKTQGSHYGGQYGRSEEQRERGQEQGSRQEHRQKQGRGKSSGKEQGQDGREERIPSDLDDVLERLKNELGYGSSFDVVVREMTFGERRVAFVFMNGLAKDSLQTEVLKRLTYLQPDDLSTDALHAFLDMYVPASQVKSEQDWNKLLTGILSGGTALFIDKEATALLIDAKNFPARSPDEPSLERVVRGSRDGFVETLMMNVSLVRRRLRDPQLRYELVQIGERTQTDVCIAYINDLVDKELLKSIKEKISMVKVDGIPLADKQLEEATVKRGWSPFPLVRYSERPDVVASHLLEGAVVVFVDTSPSVMILPTTYFDLMQHAEENRQTPFIGTYLRWVRFIGIFASLFLLPLWLLFVIHPELKPQALEFLGPSKTGKLPLLVQFLLAEVGVDLLRLASVHTPTSLATAMSLVSAILIGDIAVQTGIFVNEVILYMSVAAIGMFATPSYELGLANRIVRLVLITLVAAFKVPGFIVGTTVILLFLCMERSFNRPYMWPFIPFDFRAMMNIIFRTPLLQNRRRPNLLRPQQLDKMPETE
ncbi:stage V sporulation protein AF [Paenibacillus algorifonticola]|uniref:Stage V sporulation protein AF n=1 Tax=Paenibacillus algorifonticola TaxID=684063 RepID=A0A1I2EGZ9_9BACL|nr:spore germination protein [Paenibacillus algorifonticola]SFE92344.1 stage V sporulation protein AF [Paenibacillus algorifonticola]